MPGELQVTQTDNTLVICHWPRPGILNVAELLEQPDGVFDLVYFVGNDPHDEQCRAFLFFVVYVVVHRRPATALPDSRTGPAPLL